MLLQVLPSLSLTKHVKVGIIPILRNKTKAKSSYNISPKALWQAIERSRIKTKACMTSYHTTSHLLYLFCINAYVYNFAFYSSRLLCYSFDYLSYQKKITS